MSPCGYLTKQKAHIVPHEDVTRNYRDREEEILFMDLRQRGEPFEKKYVQFSEQDIRDFADTLHTWQQEGRKISTRILQNIVTQLRKLRLQPKITRLFLANTLSSLTEMRMSTLMTR